VAPRSDWTAHQWISSTHQRAAAASAADRL